MKPIGEYIQQDVLLPRLLERRVLVVYDPELRYGDLCRGLAAGDIRVVDASEGSIESRAEALAVLREMGNPTNPLKGLLVYVPAKPPVSDEERQRDPFSLYAVAGRAFPESDGDEYMSMCLVAKADHITEVRRIFSEDPSPSFEVIDAIGGGTGWPKIQVTLGVESAHELLVAFMAPDSGQMKRLRSSKTWVSEVRKFLVSAVGLNLLTKLRSWEPMAVELWRYMLLSDLAFDVGARVPDSLASVPVAPPEAKHLVQGVCDSLRNDRRTQSQYIERAEEVERSLQLAAHCAGVEDLGTRETFPFQERALLRRALRALHNDDVVACGEIIAGRHGSVWRGRGESQAQWDLLNACMLLIAEVKQVEAELPAVSQDLSSLIETYSDRFCGMDRLQRELAQAAASCVSTEDVEADMESAKQLAQRAYRRAADKLQSATIRLVEQSGWPPAGVPSNADLFEKVIEPLLVERGRRVALFLIDALRYELGATLSAQLATEGRAQVRPYAAQLPTITAVGMASLLPNAAQDLYLEGNSGTLAVRLGNQALPHVDARMAVYASRYGQRFAHWRLDAFVSDTPQIASEVDLLVIRDSTMDEQMESNPDTAFDLLPQTLRRIRVAMRRLVKMGFAYAVVATDHGFLLNVQPRPGDVCPKPPGNWIALHDRCLLGAGSPDGTNLLREAGFMGVRGDFPQLACPRGLVAYRSGVRYIHGGVSLQEGVVPVITVELASPKLVEKVGVVTLAYRSGATNKITTRIPVIDVSFDAGVFPVADEGIEVRLEARDKKGNLVGEAKIGGPVDPATGCVQLMPGSRVQVPLRMQEDFEGEFIVRVVDPTTLVEHAKLNLKTDYLTF